MVAKGEVRRSPIVMANAIVSQTLSRVEAGLPDPMLRVGQRTCRQRVVQRLLLIVAEGSFVWSGS
jgi:hypothetical protein